MHLKENPFATCPVGEHRVGKLIPQRQSQLAKFLPPSQNASPIREIKIGSLAALPAGKGNDRAVGDDQLDSSSSGTLMGMSQRLCISILHSLLQDNPVSVPSFLSSSVNTVNVCPPHCRMVAGWCRRVGGGMCGGYAHSQL